MIRLKGVNNMITITIEFKNNEIKLKTEGHGNNSDVIKEATFLIDHTIDIYTAVVDQLPPFARLNILLNSVINFRREE